MMEARQVVKYIVSKYLTVHTYFVRRVLDRTHGNTVHGVTQAQFAAITRWLGLREMEAMVCTTFSIGLVAFLCKYLSTNL